MKAWSCLRTWTPYARLQDWRLRDPGLSRRRTMPWASATSSSDWLQEIELLKGANRFFVKVEDTALDENQSFRRIDFERLSVYLCGLLVKSLNFQLSLVGIRSILGQICNTVCQVSQ